MHEFLFYMQYGCHSQSERRARHKIGNDAFMRFAFVDLTELFLIIDFYADSVFKNILYVLLLLYDRLVIFF